MGQKKIFWREMFINILRFDTILFVIIYIIWYVLVVLFPRQKQEVSYEQTKKYHHYFLIPCLNEEAVIADTIKFWNKRMEQRDNIKIYLINDASEDNTLQLMKNLVGNDSRYIIVDRKKPNAQTGKGDALNYAYKKVLDDVKANNYDTTQTLITIFDADALIKEEYLSDLEANFYVEEIALVQARVAIINRNKWLGKMQDIDFYTCVDGIQNFRELLGNVGAGGNGQSIRLSTIMDQDEPWGKALLEDFEFSTRLLMRGLETRYMYKSAVYQQGVDKYWPFIKQRARWAQGGIQCLKYRKLIRKNDKLKLSAKLEMFYFMILPFISIIGIVSYILLSIIIVLTPHAPMNPLFVIAVLFLNFSTGIIISVKYYFQNNDKIQILELIKAILLGFTILVYDWCLVPCQVMAIWRQYRGTTNWVKTNRENVNYEEIDQNKSVS